MRTRNVPEVATWLMSYKYPVNPVHPCLYSLLNSARSLLIQFMHSDPQTLLDIANFTRLAMGFSKETGRSGLQADLKLHSAILHLLTLIGEAQKRLSDSFIGERPLIPGVHIAGMQDHLINDYPNLDFGLVWETVKRDIPELLQYIEPQLPKEE